MDFARRRRDAVMLVSVNRVVEDVVGLLSHDPRARSVSVEIELADHFPGVRAREDDLVQVLLNLGVNALDAMPEGGRLRYETLALDDGVELRASDTGAGILEEAEDRLFEPFFTTKAAGRGTGLGLFVGRRIVSSIRGHLTLVQTGPAGAVFSVQLRCDPSGWG